MLAYMPLQLVNRGIFLNASCLSRSLEFEDVSFYEVPDLPELQTCHSVEGLVSKHCNATSRPTIRLTRAPRNSDVCAPRHCERTTSSNPWIHMNVANTKVGK